MRQIGKTYGLIASETRDKLHKAMEPLLGELDIHLEHLILSTIPKINLPRQVLFRRFSEWNTEFYVTGADIALRNRFFKGERNYSFVEYARTPEKIFVKEWLAPPENVMDDYNLLLKYSIAPSFFPRYNRRFRPETTNVMDLQTGEQVGSSAFVLEESLPGKINGVRYFVDSSNIDRHSEDMLANGDGIRRIYRLITTPPTLTEHLKFASDTIKRRYNREK